MASSCAYYRTTAATTLAGAALATRAYAFSSMPLSSGLGRTAAATAARSHRSPGAVMLPAWRSAACRSASSSSSPTGKRTPPPPPKPLPYHAKKKTATATTTTTSLPSSLAPATERGPAAAAAPPSPTSPKRAPPGGGGPSSSSSSSSSSKAEPVDQLVRSRWIGIFGMGAAALCLGSFSASLWLANSAPPPAYTTGREPGVPTGRPAIESPVEFDLHLDKSEWRSGITALRRRLAARARGHVLEVAFGTGRNVEFYDWAFADAAGEAPDPQADKKKKEEKTPAAPATAEAGGLRSFTGVDISPAMLDLGLRRLRQNVPAAAGLADALPKQPSFAALAAADTDAGGGGGGCVRLLDGRLRVYAADAQDALPAPPGAEPYYDTVVQTFGLCSVRDPARLLRALAAAVRPGTGRILLLEHGRSDWWDGVNRMLDRSARGHFERFGCWWNRDIERLVRDAQEHVPGLELVALERPGWATFGTHVWVELRVRPTALAAPEKAVAATAPSVAGNFLSRLLGSWGSSAK